MMGALSLKWKYIIFTLLILFIVLGGFFLYNLKYQERLIIEDDKERVELIAEIIKNGLITIMLEGRGKEFQKFLESLIAEDIKEVRIFRPSDGAILASSIPTEVGEKIYTLDMQRYMNQDQPEVFTRQGDGEPFYSMVVPIPNERPCQRCHRDDGEVRGVLDVEVSTRKTAGRISELRERTAVFSLLTFLSLAVALAILTTLLVNRPVEGIIRTMKKVEAGDLSVRFVTGRKDEIGRLAASLNSMLAELDKARQEIHRCHAEEMRHVERMATMGELAAALAHEIKNPLASISSAIQVISDDFGQDDPRREVIEDVVREIERLDKTVRDLLSFAKPSEPKRIYVDIRTLIERTVSLVKAQAEKQNIQLRVDYGKDVDGAVFDPQQIQQVMMNIILNAFHAMPGGGALQIGVRKVDETLQISLSDTGEGIPEKSLKSIFKPFFTTRHTGTGLGLAISRNIVEAHGGEIRVESQVGIGSTFKIILPA